MFKRRKKQFVNSYYKPISSMKINDIITKAHNDINNNSKITDSEGLSRAYNSPNSVYVDGNRMYISGTHNLRDVFDDITKIPFWGDVKNSERYQQAATALKDNPQVDTVIGHSLGGSVALEINKQNNNQFKTRTYGAPVLDFSFDRNPNNQRFRHPGDRISMFDTGAVNEEQTTTYGLINPHTYDDYPINDEDNEKPIIK